MKYPLFYPKPRRRRREEEDTHTHTHTSRKIETKHTPPTQKCMHASYFIIVVPQLIGCVHFLTKVFLDIFLITHALMHVHVFFLWSLLCQFTTKSLFSKENEIESIVLCVYKTIYLALHEFIELGWIKLSYHNQNKFKNLCTSIQ